MTRPDVGKVLAQLKGFQRRTVDYAFERLYAPDSSRRFLVADEVGLGKTLVARGVIARTVDHLWDRVDRIDVVYICSNADIARQNVAKLNITGERRFELASRVTLLPIVLQNLRGSRLNFVSFTPGTSFDLQSNLGQRRERVLLYWLLHHVWDLRGTGPKNVLQGGVQDTDGFRRHLDTFDRDGIDASLAEAFAARLQQEIDRDRVAGRPDLRHRFEELCERFGYARKHIPAEDRRARSQMIGALRELLAATCLKALEPDLVILDEFQRFKYLLDGQDESSALARELFGYADHVSEARVLLLSATPYKMYTLVHERHEDDHYEDFLRTVEFLDPAQANGGGLRTTLEAYRRELYRLADGDGARVGVLKTEIESALRRTMCRTERVGMADSHDGMLTEVPAAGLSLEAGEVHAFARLQRVARELERGNVVDYWKSAPYLLNFMEHYEIKRDFDDATTRRRDTAPLARHLGDGDGLLLPWKAIRRYDPVPAGNARLRALLAPLLEVEAWRLLWLPPSLPYYELDAPFAAAARAGLTKRLIFSTWAVVPRAVAALVSYEVERLTFHALEPMPQNSPAWRERRRGLLRFAVADGRLVGMPVLGLIHPSLTLAALGDPLAARAAAGGPITRAAALEAAAGALRPALEPLLAAASSSGDVDEAWYWAAPILLDRARAPEAPAAWWDRADLASVWAGSDADEEHSRWAEHVAQGRDVSWEGLGRPPADLVEVLAEFAIGSPAVCALRALSRVLGAPPDGMAMRDAAAQIGWAFRGLWNQVESTAVIRALAPDLPYWRAALGYAGAGCLQAVLDEYVHVLRDDRGVFDLPHEEAAQRLAKDLGSALALRTSTLRIDDIRVDPRRESIETKDGTLRTHFAMRLGAEPTENGSGEQREDRVRLAFNSPFRPFVLASTSVGQEGLDFHPYCHAVVHWNLPANPVDLEQREGRVHRYKGHAIRRNVATAFGGEVLGGTSGDPWERVFERASAVAGNGDHGLVPYWLFTVPGGARIERHVLALPLSADAAHLEVLRRSLAVYRMVFGQPRQDDLLAYLSERVPAERLAEVRKLLRIELAPAAIAPSPRTDLSTGNTSSPRSC